MLVHYWKKPCDLPVCIQSADKGKLQRSNQCNLVWFRLTSLSPNFSASPVLFFSLLICFYSLTCHARTVRGLTRIRIQEHGWRHVDPVADMPSLEDRHGLGVCHHLCTYMFLSFFLYLLFLVMYCAKYVVPGRSVAAVCAPSSCPCCTPPAKWLRIRLGARRENAADLPSVPWSR